jgi:hypothetical protein
MFSKILMIVALGILAYLVFITMTEQDNFNNAMKAGKQMKNKILGSTNKPMNKIIDNIQPMNKLMDKIQDMDKPIFKPNNNIMNTMIQSMDKPIAQPMDKPIDKSIGQEINNIFKKNNPNDSPLNNIFKKNNPNDSLKNMASRMFKKQENMIDTESNINYEHFADINGITDNLYGAAPFGANAPVSEGDMATVNYTGLVDAQPGDVIQIEGTDLLTAPLVDNMLYTNSIANTNRNSSQDLRGDIPLQFNDNYTPFYSSVIYGAPLSQKQMTIGNI